MGDDICEDCGRETCEALRDRASIQGVTPQARAECLRLAVARLREQLAEARASLRPFAEIDLTKTEQPTNFAWCVLRARRALEMK